MKRFEVWTVRLDPVLGSEIGKTRPGVIVSPDEANEALRTVLIAPLTSVRRVWPTRVPVEIDGVEGDAALDHIRAVDKRHLLRRQGEIAPPRRARFSTAWRPRSARGSSGTRAPLERRLRFGLFGIDRSPYAIA